MAQNGKTKQDPEIDSRGFLVVGGIKVCKVTADGLLEFKDKNHIRAKKRGSPFVYTDTGAIEDAVEAFKE